MTEDREHNKLYEGAPTDSMPAYVRAVLRIVIGPTCLVCVDGEPLPKRFHLRPDDRSSGELEIVEEAARGSNSPHDNPNFYARRRIADEELAINLLADAAGLQAAGRHYAAFAEDVVRPLPLNDTWVLPETRIRQWLIEQQRT